MALIDWDSDLSLGVPEIDRQHRMLIDHINDLYDAMNGGKDRAARAVLLEKLTLYATFHFAREEDYFLSLGYPGAQDHIRQHDAFEVRLRSFESAHREGADDLTTEILNFLCEWLVDHIKGSDKKVADFSAACNSG